MATQTGECSEGCPELGSGRSLADTIDGVEREICSPFNVHTFNVDTPTLFSVRANFSEHEGALLIHDSLGNVVWAGVPHSLHRWRSHKSLFEFDDYYLGLSSLQEVDVPTYQLSIPSSVPLIH